MKTLTFTLILGFFLTNSLMAQEEQVVLKRVASTEVPVEVTSAIEEDFPDAVVDEIAIVPEDVYVNEWTVSSVRGKSNPNEEVHYYAIKLYGDRSHAEVVYDDKGDIVNYKEVITDEALPASIRNYIGENYNGWAFIKDKEVIKKTPKGEADMYTVTIRKDKKTKTLHFDGEGRPVK
ncbi:hypothetical protein V6R21_30400 [Limibacter armeniacum]|uniref:hypothetical protein n=1 Tax=Limibacter armeniacum TaxID=466084 RepID=UPI002FE681E2